MSPSPPGKKAPHKWMQRGDAPERVGGTLTLRVLLSFTSAVSSILVRDCAIASASHSMPTLRFIHCMAERGGMGRRLDQLDPPPTAKPPRTQKSFGSGFGRKSLKIARMLNIHWTGFQKCCFAYIFHKGEFLNLLNCNKVIFFKIKNNSASTE